MANKKDRRMVADCRLFPSEKKCSLTIAGTENEVLEIAVQHAVKSHGHKNSPQLREEVRKMLRPEASIANPPIARAAGR